MLSTSFEAHKVRPANEIVDDSDHIYGIKQAHPDVIFVLVVLKAGIEVMSVYLRVYRLC